jgi:chemotaxis regulatin CheY-phosphate phosphatase CheZ
MSLPASNDNIFELSDFHNLVTTVRNYDADREAQSYVKTHQQLFELLMPKKI